MERRHKRHGWHAAKGSAVIRQLHLHEADLGAHPHGKADRIHNGTMHKKTMVYEVMGCLM